MTGLLALAGAGCGEDEDEDEGREATAVKKAPEQKSDAAGAASDQDAAAAQGGSAKGTTVVLDDSEFGEMLFDADEQAIYVFERDTSAKSVCYGECAAAWPPVVSKGEPVAGKGVDASLLGSSERRDGSVQVTYGDKPLYYYAHEAPGEVRCHNVDLNGGLWWVVGADGEPLA
jgi:predicted lipoprotein with Yx(FWY)xxD motif